MKRVDPSRNRGFTLIDLIISVGLMAFLAVLLANCWRAVGKPIANLVVRGRVAQEASLAVAALQHDLGGALAGDTGRPGLQREKKFVGRVQPDNSELWLCFDGGSPPNGYADWAAPDIVIVYQLDQGRLVRWDQNAGTSVIVARHVESLELLPLGDRAQIRLTVSYRSVSRTFTLVTCDP